jgi:hypothetical protein
MLVPYINNLIPDMSAVPRTLKIQGNRLFHGTLSGETLVGYALITKASYINATSEEITVPLPDTLPARRVRCFVSGDLSPFPSLLTPPEVKVTIGSDGPHDAIFSSIPTTPVNAARQLQVAIRTATGGGPAFKGARVTAAGNRLVVVLPVGMWDTVAFTGSAATSLKLTAAEGGTSVFAYLSGELAPFPKLTADNPAVRFTLGGTSTDITIIPRPTSLTQAASVLETALQTNGFLNAAVTALENQLLILPGAPGDATFDKVSGVDEFTVAELQLRARFSVRVRVNGAESIDDKGLEMP